MISLQPVAALLGASACTAAIAALQAVRTEEAGLQGFRNQLHAFGDHRAVPEAPILILKKNQIPLSRGARRAPRFLQQHEREEALCFRLGQELHQEPPDADRFLRKLGARHRGSGGGGVALVEDEVDDAQHGVEPLGKLGPGRHFVRDARVADLGLRAHDALRDGRRRGEEGVRDLLGLQPADLAQGQRHLRVGRERRVAAGEDEAQAVVLDGLGIRGRFGDEIFNRFLVENIESALTPDGVDRLEAPGRDQPRARVRRHALARPLLERGTEGFRQRFLGEVEVAQEPHQRGEYPARFRAVEGL